MHGSVPALIVDPDSGFLDSLRREIDSAATLGKVQSPPILVSNWKDAQVVIADARQPFSGIFVNAALPEGGALSVVRFAHLKRAATPLFLTHDGERPPFSRVEIEKMAVHAALKKPLSYDRILSIVAPLIQDFDPVTALRIAQGNEDPLGGLVDAEKAEFVPILAMNFVSGKKSFFDIYVRIHESRYLKVLQAGDTFPPERLQPYLRRGVTHFYLRREAQVAYVSYCEHLSQALLNAPSAPIEVKSAQTMNFGREVMSFLHGKGVDEGRIQTAERFTQAVGKLVRQPEFRDSTHVSRFIADLPMYEHGAATTALSAFLFRPLGLGSSKLQGVIGISSLLHDLGLRGLLPPDSELRLGNVGAEGLSEVDYALYLSHPLHGAQLLSQVRGIDPIVIESVAKHHERRTGNGFPRRLGSGGISVVAEIVGICDEFVRLIELAKKDSRVDPFQIMTREVFDGFSFPVIQAFKAAFMNRR